MKVAAILDVPQAACEFICGFEGALPGPVRANPTYDGIAFIRFPGLALSEQLGAFAKVHRALIRERGEGLTAAIVPHELGSDEGEWPGFIRGIRAFAPRATTILVSPTAEDASRRHFDHVVDPDDGQDEVRTIQRILGFDATQRDPNWMARERKSLNALISRALGETHPTPSLAQARLHRPAPGFGGAG